MTKNKTRSGNKKRKKIKVCSKCKKIYETRLTVSYCPNCGKRHHSSKLHRWKTIANKEYRKPRKSGKK